MLIFMFESFTLRFLWKQGLKMSSGWVQTWELECSSHYCIPVQCHSPTVMDLQTHPLHFCLFICHLDMIECFIYIYVCAQLVPAISGCQKKHQITSDGIVESHHMDAGNHTQVLWKNNSTLNH